MGVARGKMETLFHVLISTCLAFAICGKYNSSSVICLFHILAGIPKWSLDLPHDAENDFSLYKENRGVGQ